MKKLLGGGAVVLLQVERQPASVKKRIFAYKCNIGKSLLFE
jgi:hypothetical protein